jgi:putative membrane-bound dehydrogenase-like protein
MQNPLPPEESLKHWVAPPGFTVSLFASEPEIVKPICMAWDARGRLWIAETLDYPNEQRPPGEGRDRIKICEDTDHDGKADKFTVFADHLSIPTGMVFANGGLIVIEGGHTLFLKDTNGDDQADVRQILFEGWGMGDTHATASNLRWGLDNWVWGVVGYSGFNGTVGGKPTRFSMGFFRFKPDGSELEFIRSSNNNTWGLGFSEEGIVFGSTANNNPSMYLPIPNRFYEAVSGWSAARLESIADSPAFYPVTDKVRQVDAHGRYTAGAGHALYTARSFPKEYWNRVAFVAEPTGHLVGKFRMEAHGADFVARNEHTFLASDDEWSAPIAAEVGPDGNLWVIDWYNYIVQHNPTPAGFQTGRGNAYDTPLRDKRHGRIYRVTSSSGSESHAPIITGANAKDLVAALKSDNQLWRIHAQRLLVELKNREIVSNLIALTEDRSVDPTGLNVGAIHSLATLSGLGAIPSEDSKPLRAVRRALHHPSAGVRREAVTVLPRTAAERDTLLREGLLKDGDAQVRLATLLALAEMPASDRAGAAIASAIQDPTNSSDRWLMDAATAAAARNDSGFLKAIFASVSTHPTPAAPITPGNLIPNGSFESETNGVPLSWRITKVAGNAETALSEESFQGARSIRIDSDNGAEASWSTVVPVERFTVYTLSGYIRTGNVRTVGTAKGVAISAAETEASTPSILGTKDWVKAETSFNSGDHTQLTIRCEFGGGGLARGWAGFDDIRLVRAPSGTLPGTAGQVLRIVTGHYGNRGAIDTVVPTILALPKDAPGLAVPFLDGLLAGWPMNVKPNLKSGEPERLLALATGLLPEASSSLAALMVKWGYEQSFSGVIDKLASHFRSQIADGSAPPDERVTVARRLITIRDDAASMNVLLGCVTPQAPPNLVNGIIAAAALSHQKSAAGAMLQTWPQLTPGSRRQLISALLRRPEWAITLLDAVEKKSIRRTELSNDHWNQLRSHPDKTVAALAQGLDQSAGRTSSPDMEALIKSLSPVASMPADGAEGQKTFETVCAVCHAVKGKGARIGPDLTGIGIRPKSEILVEIIDPNRSVEENYRLWTVTTKGGESIAGRLDGETATTIEILDTAGQKHVVQHRDIQALEASNQSIMPTGFDQLPRQDLANVLEFLALSAKSK